MTRVSSKHGVPTTKMEQLYTGGMTMKGERYVMSSTKMEGMTRMTQGHG